MMRIPKYILVGVITVVGCMLYACNDQYLDVNKNPNVVTDVTEAQLLSGIFGPFSYEIMGSGATRIGAMWMQQISSNNPTPNIDTYFITSVGEVNNQWNSVYTDVLINAKILNEKAENDKYYDYAAIAKTLTAWTLVYATNAWGPIPYSESLQGDQNLKPKFDSQKSIYQKAQKLLSGALDDLNKESVKTPSGHDLLYQGNMSKWKRLIYTLKARFYITLTNAPDHDEKQQAQKALNALKKGFSSNEDDADFAYYETFNARNPYYQWAISDKWHDQFTLSDNYVKLLKSLNDPRLPSQGRLNNDGVYRGHVNGTERENQNTLSLIGKFYSAPAAPLAWSTYAEAQFIKAEAKFRISGASDAQPDFENAIRASMDKLNVSKEKADIYIASLPTLAASENALKELMQQKYIADFLLISVYNDWRRTGYPRLKLSKNHSLDQIPLRLTWPRSVITTNEENLKETGIPEGTDGMIVPVWWDSKN